MSLASRTCNEQKRTRLQRLLIVLFLSWPQVGVHIADVTHFIRPGTALDDEAANRGTTVYLTDKVQTELTGEFVQMPYILGTLRC